MNDQQNNDNLQKLAWQTPVMEELDVASTEAAYVYGGGADAGIYTF